MSGRFATLKHADAWASFEDQDGGTKVTLGMVFGTAAGFQEAKGFGAVEPGLQTLGKLERRRLMPAYRRRPTGRSCVFARAVTQLP